MPKMRYLPPAQGVIGQKIHTGYGIPQAFYEPGGFFEVIHRIVYTGDDGHPDSHGDLSFGDFFGIVQNYLIGKSGVGLMGCGIHHLYVQKHQIGFVQDHFILIEGGVPAGVQSRMNTLLFVRILFGKGEQCVHEIRLGPWAHHPIP